MKVGDKVTVIYDPRPVFPFRILVGTIKAITKSGFLRIQTEKTEDGFQYNELFYQAAGGHARGWNTLWWIPFREQDHVQAAGAK